MRSAVWKAVAVGAAALAVHVASGVAYAGLRETFEEGNEAFWSGDFAGAVRAWESLVDLGVWDADVHYNIGTAEARLGHRGRAILSYERALLLDPGHDDARANLTAVRRALARLRTEGGEDADVDPPRSFWMSLLARLTPSQVVVPFLVCWLGFFGALTARRLVRREVPRLVLVVVALALGVGAVVGGVLVAGKASYDGEVREAIVVADGEATLREGPNGRFRRVAGAREGDRLRVLDREGEWLHLRDAQGREGWGRVAEVGELRAPER